MTDLTFGGEVPQHKRLHPADVPLTIILAIVAFTYLCLASVCFSQTANPAKQQLQAAIKLIRDANYPAAEKILKKTKSDSQTGAESWYYLGVIYVQRQDFKKAISAFETAIKIRPGLAEPHNGLAYALLRRGKVNDARREVEKALAINPMSVDAHYTMGVIELRSGANESAINHADKAIEQSPKFAEAYLLKSQALVSFNVDSSTNAKDAKEERAIRYQKAATALEKYLQLVPDSPTKTIWKEQFDSLSFYSAANHDSASPEPVYVGKDVTTKARLISKPEPQYTEAARNAQVAGTVVLKTVFAADGLVKHIIVLQTLPYGLTEQAVLAAKKIKFIPATLNGKPTSMFIQLEYNFNLY